VEIYKEDGENYAVISLTIGTLHQTLWG